MRIPAFVLRPLTRWVKRRYTNYMIPSQTIRENADDPTSPILIQRHNILSLPGFKVRAHEIVRSDNVRDLHDHPWANMTLVLEGGYYEMTPTGVIERKEGDLVFRGAKARHQIFLPIEPLYLGYGNISTRFQSAAEDVAVIDWDALKNASHSPDEADRSAIHAIALAANLIKTNIGEQDVPCLTLFIHGRVTRRWGFWSADGSFRPSPRQS